MFDSTRFRTGAREPFLIEISVIISALFTTELWVKFYWLWIFVIIKFIISSRDCYGILGKMSLFESTFLWRISRQISYNYFSVVC